MFTKRHLWQLLSLLIAHNDHHIELRSIALICVERCVKCVRLKRNTSLTIQGVGPDPDKVLHATPIRVDGSQCVFSGGAIETAFVTNGRFLPLSHAVALPSLCLQLQGSSAVRHAYRMSRGSAMQRTLVCVKDERRCN